MDLIPMHSEFKELDRLTYINKLLALIERAAFKAIKSRKVFHFVISGGESPQLILRALKDIETDWNAWQVWFADERCLALGDENLNSLMAENEFLRHVDIKAENIHKIQGHLGPVKAAELYGDEIKNIPDFDLTLLGLGEDGHTASLFPENYIGMSTPTEDVLPVFNSPKPPSERVSLSLPRINRSEKILFLVTGNKKRTIVDSFLKRELMPATLVKGKVQTSMFYCPEC